MDLNLLKKIREVVNLSQYKVATHININVNDYCKKESGKTHFTSNELLRFINFINPSIYHSSFEKFYEDLENKLKG